MASHVDSSDAGEDCDVDYAGDDAMEDGVWDVERDFPPDAGRMAQPSPPGDLASQSGLPSRLLDGLLGTLLPGDCKDESDMAVAMADDTLGGALVLASSVGGEGVRFCRLDPQNSSVTGFIDSQTWEAAVLPKLACHMEEDVRPPAPSVGCGSQGPMTAGVTAPLSDLVVSFNFAHPSHQRDTPMDIGHTTGPSRNVRQDGMLAMPVNVGGRPLPNAWKERKF